MASADYKLCDVCSSKHFYDAGISDENYLSSYYKGGVKSICDKCLETHEIVIIEREKILDIKVKQDE